MRDGCARMMDDRSRRGGPEMKFISMDAIMTRRKSFVCASFAVAMVIGAMTCGATSPAFAGRQVHGSDVARLLSGRTFRIECIDGTVGRGQVSVAGVANVSYRRPSMSGPDETDHALVRVKGAEICLAWKQFGGGGDGCYPVSEEVAGSRYRLSTGPLWCDISPK
jgi:hypothetical protein